MPRVLRWLILAAVVSLALAPDAALAVNAAKWPEWFAGDVSKMDRGPGFYLSWIKLAAAWIVFIAWVATADWLNADAQRHRLNFALWNPLMVFPFAAALLAFWFIPYYAAGIALLVLAWVVPSLVYVVQRNGKVEAHERVLTPDHLRFVAAERLRPLGIKIQAQRKRSDEIGPPIKLVAQGGATPADDNARYFTARNLPGFLPAKELIYDAITRRADSIMLDYTAQAVSIRQQIDGVWHNGDTRDRENGDAILAVLKTLAALNPNERRARQQGKFTVQQEKLKWVVTIATQGTQTGERVVTQFDDNSARFQKLPDLGMREKLIEQVKELLGERRGIVLLSAPPKGGLTSLTNAVLGSSDRYTRSFVAVEDVQKPEKPIENIPVTTYDSKAGETPLTVLPKMARLYPDVIVCRDFVSGETVDFLCGQTEEDRLVVAGIRAKEAVEALLRVLTLKVPPARFAPVVLGVINTRLIRKLCETCREAYQPPPNLLQQLRIPAGKVEAFYRPPQQPEQVCPDCGGIGFLGRTAIFEILVMNDHLKTVLAKTPKLEILRQEARKQGMRGLQEEGILLVAKGVTSLQELMRVLKE